MSASEHADRIREALDYLHSYGVNEYTNDYRAEADKSLDALVAERDVLEAALEQACRDLNQAHDEILRVQGCPEHEIPKRDWPEWTPQANTIRWAERLLGKPLGKTSLARAALAGVTDTRAE